MQTYSACRVVGQGGVGESGSSETLAHQVDGPSQKVMVLRRGATSLCPNMGAVAVMLRNGQLVDQGVLSGDSTLLQSQANPDDQIVAIVHMFPLFNDVVCVRLGELNVTLEECELVTSQADTGHVLDVACVDTRNWYAWNNRMPPPPDDFHVVGEVDVPNPGVEVRLMERSPQGINPAYLLLDLVLYQQPGIWPQVVTTKQVRFDKILVRSNYEQAHVFQSRKLIAKVPVETIQ